MGHYDELGVAPTASPAEIRKSYLDLARRHHPDGLFRATPAERQRAAERMALINAAWSVLSDRERRLAYDAGRAHGDGSGATIRDVGASWTPYDADDTDHPDPDLFDDTPSGAPTLHRSLTFLPAGLAAAGLIAVVSGFMVGLSGVLAAGVLLLAAGGLAFLLIPLVALFNSSRADRDW